MKLLLILPLLSFASSCAHTDFYHKGQRVAHFEGDMRGMTFEMKPDGTLTWRCESVSHSAATEAQGRSGAGKIAAVGTAVAGAGVATLFQ